MLLDILSSNGGKKSHLLFSACAILLGSFSVNAASTVTSVTAHVEAYAEAGAVIDSQSFDRPPVIGGWIDNAVAVASDFVDLGFCDPVDPFCAPTFVDAVASADATLESFVSPLGESFFASGVANADAFTLGGFFLLATANALSVFEVSFTLGSTYNYILGGNLIGDSSNVSFNGAFFQGASFIPTQFGIGGVLTPGTYTLHAETSSLADASGLFQGQTTFDVGLELIPEVPIPTAVWLFSSGLISLIGVARRKKA